MQQDTTSRHLHPLVKLVVLTVILVQAMSFALSVAVTQVILLIQKLLALHVLLVAMCAPTQQLAHHQDVEAGTILIHLHQHASLALQDVPLAAVQAAVQMAALLAMSMSPEHQALVQVVLPTAFSVPVLEHALNLAVQQDMYMLAEHVHNAVQTATLVQQMALVIAIRLDVMPITCTTQQRKHVELAVLAANH